MPSTDTGSLPSYAWLPMVAGPPPCVARLSARHGRAGCRTRRAARSGVRNWTYPELDHAARRPRRRGDWPTIFAACACVQLPAAAARWLGPGTAVIWSWSPRWSGYGLRLQLATTAWWGVTPAVVADAGSLPPPDTRIKQPDGQADARGAAPGPWSRSGSTANPPRQNRLPRGADSPGHSGRGSPAVSSTQSVTIPLLTVGTGKK